MPTTFSTTARKRGKVFESAGLAFDFQVNVNVEKITSPRFKIVILRDFLRDLNPNRTKKP